MTLLIQAQPQTHSAESHQFTRSPFHLIHPPHILHCVILSLWWVILPCSYVHFYATWHLSLYRNTVIHKHWSMVQRLGVTGLKSGFQLTYTRWCMSAKIQILCEHPVFQSRKKSGWKEPYSYKISYQPWDGNSTWTFSLTICLQCWSMPLMKYSV